VPEHLTRGNTVAFSGIQAFNLYPANVENMVGPTNASKWRMGFNSAFKELNLRS
jgi:hypothetical protein